MIGFDEKDSAILAALDKKEQNMLALATSTGIGRKTVAYRLDRMARYKLVEEKVSRGKQKVWGLSAASTQHKRKAQVYHGRDVLRAKTAFASKVPKKSVMYTIEGHAFTRLMNTTYNKPPYSTLGQRAQTLYRKRNITLKSLMHTNIASALPVKDPHGMLEIRKNRSIETKYLDHKSLLGPCAYVFTPEAMIMINMQKVYAVLITDEVMARTMYDMMGMLYEILDSSHGATRQDFSKFIEHLIAARRSR
jgi:hypothetical protein